MTSQYLSTFVFGPLLGTLATLAVGLVSYLASLEIKDLRRNRRLDAERERLGLK